MQAVAPLPELVAANVRRVREHKGWTQGDLAEAMRREPRWIRRIESGSLDLRLSTVEALARALEVDALDLLKRARLVRRPSGRPRSSGKGARPSGSDRRLR